MADWVPVVPVLVLFGVAVAARGRLKGRLGSAIALVALAFFVVMAFVDAGHKYHYALFALLAAVFLIRNIRISR